MQIPALPNQIPTLSVPETAWIKQNYDKVIGAVAAASGLLAGPLKIAIGQLRNRSSEQRYKATQAKISAGIEELRRLNENAPADLREKLEPYRTALMVRLEEAFVDLQLDKQKLEEIEHNRWVMPEGIHKWLLLFRPTSVAGWVFHSLFYTFLSLAAVTLLIGSLNGLFALFFALFVLPWQLSWQYCHG